MVQKIAALFRGEVITCKPPKYLNVTLDRILTDKLNLQKLKEKLKTHPR